MILLVFPKHHTLKKHNNDPAKDPTTAMRVKKRQLKIICDSNKTQASKDALTPKRRHYNALKLHFHLPFNNCTHYLLLKHSKHRFENSVVIKTGDSKSRWTQDDWCQKKQIATQPKNGIHVMSGVEWRLKLISLWSLVTDKKSGAEKFSHIHTPKSSHIPNSQFFFISIFTCSPNFCTTT